MVLYNAIIMRDKYYIKEHFKELLFDKLTDYEDLARRTNIHRTTLYRLHKVDKPRIVTLKVIADKLGKWRLDQQTGRHFISVTEKGNAEREIPLSDSANNIIKKRSDWLLSDDKVAEVIMAVDYNDRATEYLRRAKEGYLFFEILSLDTISHVFTKARRKLDLASDITWHSLRHTFATYYLERGGSIESLQSILGHEDLKTTAVYARPLCVDITAFVCVGATGFEPATP